MKSKKRLLWIGAIALAVCLAAVAFVLILGGNGSGEKNWTYSYEWNGSLCTATRVSGRDRETETIEGILTVQSPATEDKDGNGYYTVRFKNPDFNTNYNLGRQPVTIPAGSGFTYGKAGLNAYLFDMAAGQYYYAQVDIEATTQAGWVGFVHSADETFSEDGTYFYDTVSYKAGRNYEHSFGSVLYGDGLYENKELADAYEGPTKKGLTGVDFSIDGMTLTTLRSGDYIYLFINDKRVATYLIDRDLAICDTMVGLYFDNNSTFYSGTLSNIKIVEGQEDTEAKLAELLENSESFLYSNIQNWNKNEGFHTDAVFEDGSFTYKYDDTLDLSEFDLDLEGYTPDRRYMTGVTDRVFLSGNYYYEYEISGPVKGINNVDEKAYGLFFNYINSAMRSGIYYRQEAMWCFKENNGLERVHFDAGSGVNGDGVSGWVGGTAFGGSDNLKEDKAWQAAYKSGLIVRITRASYEEGEKAVYAISVRAKSNPDLVLISKEIVVDDEDKGDIYGGYDWIMYATQSVDCTISNVTYGRVEGKVEFGHDPDWRYSYAWNGTNCTATRTCKICGERETETAQGILVTAVVPTTETAGKAIYKVKFKNDDYNKNAWNTCKSHTVKYAAGAAFAGAVDAKKYFTFDGIEASKNYYVEMKLSAPTDFGYVGLGHLGDEKNYFYNMVCNGNEDGNYYHRFASAIAGEETVHGEIAEFLEGVSLDSLTGVDYDKDGMTLAIMRIDDTVYAFINGVRIGTYLVENELAKLDTVPVVFMENFAGGSYDGKITDVIVLSGQEAVLTKFAELTTGSAFSYTGVPNWRKSSIDATFNEEGVTYAYDTTNPMGERRFNNGVNDRVFLAGNYFYEYEIFGDMVCAQDGDKYGLLFNWINTKQRVGSDGYKHEAIFVLKLTADGKLQRLTFDAGKGAYGDGANGGWSGNTTAYGGNTNLTGDSAWQAAYKNGLVVRIERTVKENKTDVYVISVRAKNNPELQLTSQPIEVSHDTYGGYNWMLFGTQSVNCTISNVKFGKLHNYSETGRVEKEATCGEDGVLRFDCIDPGFEHLYRDEVIPATGNHAWDSAYTWEPAVPTTNGTASCTGNATCSGCSAADTETVTATYEATLLPDGINDGSAVYTAVFTKACFQTQTLSIVIPKEEHVHTWSYSYAWSGSECTATRTCVQPCTANETETVQGQLVGVTAPARKDAPGTGIYNAVFQNSYFNENATDVCEGHEAQTPNNTPFYITEGGKQTYTFEGISASKNYYIEVKLSPATKTGYVGFAHQVDGNNYFYDAVSYYPGENYYHGFGSVEGGSVRAYSEPAKFYKDTTNFAEEGMTLATLRMGNTVYTFINGKRIATYLLEDIIAAANTAPALYFNDVTGNFYDATMQDIVILSGETAIAEKLAELTAGSAFNYVATPNWHNSSTDASFTESGFTYTYNTANTAGSRRYLNGVNDRVFLAGNYYYQYEITGDITSAGSNDVYGLFYNWINTKTLSGNDVYNHEVNFVLKLNGNKLQRLTFDKGSGANGDGASGWVSNTTAYGGRNDLESDAAWQAAYKSGLIVRIERTAKNSNTDVYTISVMAKSDPSLKITSTPIEVSGDAFGGYNWILFGTQSVNCTISNVTYGKTYTYSSEGNQVKDPTCGEEGIMRYYCTTPGFEHLYIEKPIPATGAHAEWEYAYTWEGSQCTAMRACKTCGHEESETVQGELTGLVTPARKDAPGTGIYNATFQTSCFAENATADCVGHVGPTPNNTPFYITEGGKQTYAFDGIGASKNYYMEVKLSATTKDGYVGLAHWADANNYFYDVVNYDAAEKYYHTFSGVVDGTGRVYSEPAKYYKDATNFGENGMTLATLRMGDTVYTFVNGKRIATYLIEEELAEQNTVPVLYFDNVGESFYDATMQDIVVLSGESTVAAKLAALTTESAFGYVATPNFSNSFTDATFNADGFAYSYNSANSAADRRFVTGVNDRVFLAGDYYYQYEISGDIVASTGSNVYGLLYNWINTKSTTALGNYKHEVNFVLKMNGSKLQRLTFDKGSGANGDGASNWVSNTTSYGGNNSLEGNTQWQEAFKGGLIVRIERTVKNSTTDVYVISVTAKSNPAVKLTSTSIEVSDATFGGYNWILFGTQSVECTISNVTFGRP